MPVLPRNRYRLDLAHHMAECDANYQRVHALLPHVRLRGLRAGDVVELVLAAGASHESNVQVTVLDRARYTTTLELRQFNLAVQALGIPPARLAVRLYDDLHSAEVLEFQDERRFAAVYPYPNAQMRHRDEKIQLNVFLGEYLDHCIAHGTMRTPLPQGQ